METLIAEFLAYGLSQLNYSVYTIKGYRSDLLAFARWLAPQGVVTPEAITRAHIERYDVLQSETDKRPRTRRRKIAAIRAWTGWLVETERIVKNPALKIKLPAEDDAERTAPTAEEKTALFEGAARLETEYLSAMSTMMLACMFYAGLRPMEVIALDLEDIDLGKRLLVVKRGKGRKRRELPINDTLAAHIVAWLPVRLHDSGGTRLLVSPQRRAVTYYLLRTTFVKIKVAGGLRSAKRLTAHCLRHWFASKLRANKVEVEVIMELLGHTSLSTTQSYLHQLGDDRKSAVHSLDDGTAPAPPKPVLKLVEEQPATSRRRAAFRRTG